MHVFAKKILCFTEFIVSNTLTKIYNKAFRPYHLVVSLFIQ
jgi:hypothetical protein